MAKKTKHCSTAGKLTLEQKKMADQFVKSRFSRPEVEILNEKIERELSKLKDKVE